MKLWKFTILTLTFLAVAKAEIPVVSPQNDPDVLETNSKGYFELCVGASHVSAMTLDRAQEIQKNFMKHYSAPVFLSGKELEVQVDWANPYFTAHARYQGNKAQVVLWGGFLRAPGMQDEVLVTALCHELGHLIGGAPLQTIDQLENFSTEGQADFFATSRCAADFLAQYPDYSHEISDEVTTYCQENLDCARALSGGVKTIRFMEKWGYVDYFPAQLFTPEKATDKFIPNTYPSQQCRLDTFAAGARCLIPGATCARPRCWWP
jgi:hypothetical protein